MTSRPRLLIVEDNMRNQRLVALALRQRFELRFAGDGEAALQAVAEETPALVLLDIQLPQMDGFEVLRRLRERPDLATVPVVALTSRAMPEDREEIHDAGFDGHLTKPVDARSLADRVAGYLAAGRDRGSGA